MTRAAVVQTAYLGDVVLSTPLIQTLADRFGPVDVVTTPENIPLLETLATVDHIVVFDKRDGDRGVPGILRAARHLRQRDLQYVFLPHESIRSAFVARLAGVPHRIGFAGAAGAWLYTERVAPRRGATHEIDRLHSLAGSETNLPQPHVALTETDQARARTALRESGILGHYLVLAPGSRWHTKRWPYYERLAETLAHTHDVVIVGGPVEQPIGAGIVEAQHRVANLAGQLSIRETAAVLAGAQLVVCNDSVALHLAGAVHTQVVAIFGPTHPSMGFGPRGTGDIVADNEQVECRPCSSHGGSRCPLRHHRCMVELGVDTVAKMVHNALNTEAIQ